MPQERPPIRTVSQDDRTSFLRREARFRAAAAIGMVLVVIAAFAGLLGPRERTVTAESESGTVEVVHPHLTRPGLDADFTITIDPTESEGIVRLRVDSTVLAVLGLEILHPTPQSEQAGADFVEYEFATADAGPHAVTVSGRVPTKATPTRFSWEVAWVTEDDELGVTATTWVLP